MKYFTIKKHYQPKKFLLQYFTDSLWFIPSDILQRSMEANIWDLCTFKGPVLEIGIGNGIHSKMLFRKHKQFAVGIDIEKDGLETAKKTKLYKKVLWANASAMPFKDAAFNTIVSNSTFEHIREDLPALSEVARTLKKNGLFFFTVPNKFLEEWVLEYEKKKDRKNAKKKLTVFNKRAEHAHYYTLKEWEKNLKKYRLEIIYSQYYFPKTVAVFWYQMFHIFTKKIHGRELWSYLGHSKLTKIIPQQLIKKLLVNVVLQKPYTNGFLMNSGEGAQVFIVAKKKVIYLTN